MEHLSKALLALSEKTKTLLAAYAEILQENELLKDKISALEQDLVSLKLSLEQKKDLLDNKNDDSVFVSMLIEDLLDDLNCFSRNCEVPIVSNNNNKIEAVSFDLKENNTIVQGDNVI